MLTCDDYLLPASLDEAFDAMAAHAGRYRLVAGATDILPWAREGRAGDQHIPVLIDVTRIPEIGSRSVEGPQVRLGAATVFQRFLDDDALKATLPALPFCAIWFADDQIRESATIGGNLVNASPAADGTPALLTHNAELEIAARSATGITRRTVALSEFVLGPSRTVLAPDEILVSITCDALSGYGGAFEKVGHRRSLVISSVCVAVAAKLTSDRSTFTDLRIALAGVGPVPQRLDDVEAFLMSGPLSADRLEAAADMPVSRVASRTRREYRREVVHGFVLRGLMNAARRAGADHTLITPELEARYA